jgi:dTDP-L-rhamnose 4-epimerase
VRAAFADIAAAADELDWRPGRTLEDGLSALLDWMEAEPTPGTA